MGDFGRKIDRFIEIFVEQRGYVRVLEGLQNTVMIAVVGLLVGALIGTLIASVKASSARTKWHMQFLCWLVPWNTNSCAASCLLLCIASTYGSSYDRCAGIYACLWLEQRSLYIRDDACWY